MKGVSRVGRENFVMRKKNSSLLLRKVSVFVLAFLLCAGVLAGCGKDNKPGADNSTKVTAGATASATPTATATPTPSPLVLSTTYELAARDDVYRVPVQDLADGWCLMNTLCAGDYVLLWFNPPAVDENWEGNTSNVIVLLNPTVSTEQHRIELDYALTSPILLPDGTVILEEQGTERIHVYDSTLKETANFLLSGTELSFFGATEDGLLWNYDEKSAKLQSFDLKGQLVGEYPYDAKYRFTRYLGSVDGQKYFAAAVIDSSYEFVFMSLPKGASELSLRTENENDLGDEWWTDRICPMSAPVTTVASSTWFFHSPGNLREGVAFRKMVSQEQVNLSQGEWLGSINYRREADEHVYQDYRLYNLETKMYSEKLTDSEIPGSVYLSAKGVVGDGYVLLCSDRELDTPEIMLWNAGASMLPIDNFCDLAKDDLAKSLQNLINEAAQYGIEFTPDRTVDDGTIGSLGDFMSEMELVNSFVLLAKNDPELVKTKSGKALHPENVRNNDGASFTFNPHVFSTFYLKEHGEKRRDAFYAYVDALRAGEDKYYCGNEGNAAWSSGRFAMMFFPYAGLYADAEYTGDGWAKIIYKVPKEEFLQKEKEFEELVERILNDALEDDYTDFEKALALYEFLTEYTVYDYDMMQHNGEEEWNSKQSSYRVLTEKQGICGEIAMLYQYLGLQCGIDVDEVVGAALEYGADSHAWNYIKLDGKGYLIDATWGLTEQRAPLMTYFLFTDELRETRDGYDIESFDVGFCGMYGARKKFKFECKDETYGEMWNGTYVAFDEEENCIFYRSVNGVMKRFDYPEQ